MKNIFLLPTDKPSKLFIDVDNNKLTITNSPIGGEHFLNQNLYITSEEEIKDKDYILSATSIRPLYLDGEVINVSMLAEGQWKKVILATDLKLIEDGVQPIDDEFLQWYVNNSSCEKVEIDFSLVSGSFKYKIIIPQKEWISPMRPFKVKENRNEIMQRFIDNAKSHSFCETPEEKCNMNYCDENGCMNRKRELVEPKEQLIKMMQDDEELGLFEEPNIIDKWLEENSNPEIANQVELEAEDMLLEYTAQKIYPNGCDGTDRSAEIYRRIFIEGAKFQKENSYSEEEVIKLFKYYVIEFPLHRGIQVLDSEFNEWFNKVKK